MGCCPLSSCSSNKEPRILGPKIQIDQGVDRYIHGDDVVVVVVVDVVVEDDVVVDALELLQR